MKILDAVPAHLRWVNRQAGSQDENLKPTDLTAVNLINSDAVEREKKHSYR
jgi:hypothetical protein